MKSMEELITNNKRGDYLYDDEYLKDGFPYCSICGEPKYYKFDDKKIVYAICSCQKKKENEMLEKQQRYERLQEIIKIKQHSMLGKIYQDASFDKLETERDNNLMNVVDRVKSYVSNFEEIRQEGQGIYIFGDVGTGKSYLTACIGNDLTSKGYPVLFTNFSQISKMIKNTYQRESLKTELHVIKELSEIDLLIIDDIGTEKNLTEDNTFLQEKVYEVINQRYINKKSTIFTSNYSISELLKNGVERRTIDRIEEMSTAIFKITGKSFRRVIRKEPLF